MNIILFCLGACLGSFYLAFGIRVPKGIDIVSDHSRCDSCGHVLSWKELIPIFSYLFLRGRCHHCKAKISPLNIFVELTMAIAFVFSYNFYDSIYGIVMFDIVFSLMMIIFITDFKYYIILDSPLVISSILVILLDFYYLGCKQTLLYILSGVFLFGCMYLIKMFGDFLFKRESLGGGDIKFSFVIGLILGARLGLCALILSTFLALPYSYAFLALKKNNEVPYGPFLASSLFIVFVFSLKFLNLLDFLFMTI